MIHYKVTIPKKYHCIKHNFFTTLQDSEAGISQESGSHDSEVCKKFVPTNIVMVLIMMKIDIFHPQDTFHNPT